MALTTKAAVLLAAPELASVVDDARWNLAIADADQDTPERVLGAKAERAARYLVAHMLVVSERTKKSAGRGQVVSETVGPMSRTYAVQASAGGTVAEEWLRSTPYGEQYLRITAAAAGGAVLVA